MKFLRISSLLLLVSLTVLSCKKDNEEKPEVIQKVESLQIIKSFEVEDYTVELLSNSKQLIVGHNQLYLRFKDGNENYFSPSSIAWMPMMTMGMEGEPHHHSTPFSEVSSVKGKENLFEGHIMFVMASHEPDHFWELELDFTVDGEPMQVVGNINVMSTESDYNKVYTSVIGSDSTTYFLALVEPSKPKIGSNDIVVALYKSGEHHNFLRVDNYKIKVDPRMPGMGNHSAPGNEDMTQKIDGLYHGKVGFSMSGYWQINLILEDEVGTLIRGEEITEENEASSLNFKLEF